MLSDAITTILDKHIPLKKLSRKQQKLKAKPWITSDILKSIKTKNQLYKKLVKNGFNDDDDDDLSSSYKKLRNKLTHDKQKISITKLNSMNAKVTPLKPGE